MINTIKTAMDQASQMTMVGMGGALILLTIYTMATLIIAEESKNYVSDMFRKRLLHRINSLKSGRKL